MARLLRTCMGSHCLSTSIFDVPSYELLSLHHELVNSSLHLPFAAAGNGAGANNTLLVVKGGRKLTDHDTRKGKDLKS